MPINKSGNKMATIILLLMFMLLSVGCGGEIKQIDAETDEAISEKRQEIDLTELLNAVNDSVVEYRGTEYILMPFAQYRLPDGTLTDNLSEINTENLEDNKLTVYVLFQIPQQGDKLENMTVQHYIEAVIDISTYEVLSLSESDSSIENGSWTGIF